jgi:hypothetical protein
MQRGEGMAAQAQAALDPTSAATATTLITSTFQAVATDQARHNIEALLEQLQHNQNEARVQGNGGGSTINGVVIGLLSSFGSAILVALIFAIVYFFRYTSSGRIILDRIGRPGEYDDEQAYAREEAEALEEMDDLQRAEYLRAKGKITAVLSPHIQSIWSLSAIANFVAFSVHSSKPTRFFTHRHFIITVLGDSGERCFSMGIRARTRDCELFCRRADGD